MYHFINNIMHRKANRKFRLVWIGLLLIPAIQVNGQDLNLFPSAGESVPGHAVEQHQAGKVVSLPGNNFRATAEVFQTTNRDNLKRKEGNRDLTSFPAIPFFQGKGIPEHLLVPEGFLPIVIPLLITITGKMVGLMIRFTTSPGNLLGAGDHSY